MEDRFATWRSALAGGNPPIHIEHPQDGYWVSRHFGVRTPVAIYIDPATGQQVCRLGFLSDGQLVAPREVWESCCRSPLSYDAYTTALNLGRWPDLPVTEAPAPAVESEPVAPLDPAPPRDHNNPPGLLEQLRDQFEAVKREAEAARIGAVAADQAQADLASNIARRMEQIAKEADAARLAEQRPFREAIAASQGRWTPLTEGIPLAAAPLKRAAGAWVKAERERERAAAAAAVAAGAEPASVAPRKVTTGGGVGRKVTLRRTKSARVDDWTKLLAALAEHPQIRETAQSIANQSARADIALPGCSIIETETAV